MQVTVNDVSVEIGGSRILQDVSLAVPAGSWLGLLGPNGSGKSTLLRTMYRVLRPTAGAISLDERDLWRDLGARGSALRTAVVAQETSADFAVRVVDVVRTGRLPHQRRLVAESSVDRTAIAESMAQTRIEGLADRVFATLSGGEKQRVLLARALCQRSSVLILDEPTNHLDVRARFELLELARSVGLTTVAALHDLDLTLAYCDTVCVLAAGEVVGAGPVEQVLQPDLVERVFGVRAALGRHPLTGRPQLSLAPVQRHPVAADLPALATQGAR